MIFVWILLGVLALVVVAFVALYANAFRASLTRDRQLDALIQPAVDAVEAGDPAAHTLVAELAEMPAARNHLYTVLVDMNRADLFPEAARSEEQMAESDLVRWLMHPNELKTAPAAIELVRKVPVSQDGQHGRIYLFRFRTESDHWAADSGWMAGVAGPYWDGEDPAQFASGTFSELTPFDRMSEDEHVLFLKEALGRKGLVVRC